MALGRKAGGVGGTHLAEVHPDPLERCQREFLDHRDVVAELRDAGLARTEGERKPKLTIKASSNISASGRVYCVRIGGERREQYGETTP